MERDAAQCVAWGHRRESGILRSSLEDPASHPGAGALHLIRTGAGPLTDIGSPRPDWIICGGQSGRKAINMDEQWARDIRDICATAGVAFFMKQMTNKAPIPDDLMVRQFPA